MFSGKRSPEMLDFDLVVDVDNNEKCLLVWQNSSSASTPEFQSKKPAFWSIGFKETCSRSGKFSDIHLEVLAWETPSFCSICLLTRISSKPVEHVYIGALHLGTKPDLRDPDLRFWSMWSRVSSSTARSKRSCQIWIKAWGYQSRNKVVYGEAPRSALDPDFGPRVERPIVPSDIHLDVFAIMEFFLGTTML